MPETKTYHMSADDFRRCGRAVVDWIADYYEQKESMPVLSRVQPGQIGASLPAHPPQSSEAIEDILRDVTDLILPGVTHWQSPNFFA
jgi:aromatic-L-amino-acid/L-tryptophan decarboxylase